MSTKKLGLYLLSYKRPEYIVQSIESILAQTSKDFDLIVSDNTGDSSVYDLIKKFDNNQNVKIRHQPRTLKALDHFNSLIAEAKSSYKYFMLFHDDDIMEPNCIEKMLTRIESSERISAISCNASIIDVQTPTQKLFNPRLLKDTEIQTSFSLINRYLSPSLSHTPFPAYIYRSSCIENTEMNNLDGGKHSDVSFLVKIIKNGPFVWLAEPLMKYRRHQKNDSATINMSDVRRLSVYFFNEAPLLTFKIVLFYFKNFLKKYLKSTNT